MKTDTLFIDPVCSFKRRKCQFVINKVEYHLSSAHLHDEAGRWFSLLSGKCFLKTVGHLIVIVLNHVIVLVSFITDELNVVLVLILFLQTPTPDVTMATGWVTQPTFKTEFRQTVKWSCRHTYTQQSIHTQQSDMCITLTAAHVDGGHSVFSLNTHYSVVLFSGS